MTALKLGLASIGLAVLLATTAGCTADSTDGKPDNASQSDEPEKCNPDMDGLKIVDDGWSVIDDSDPGYVQIAYGVELKNSRAAEPLLKGYVEVSFLDKNGNPVTDGGTGDDVGEAPSDLREVSNLPPGDTTAVTGHAPLGEKPAKIEYTVTSQCYVEKKQEIVSEVAVSNIDVSLDSTELSLSMSVKSTYDKPVKGLVIVVFRDANGEIVSGAPSWVRVPAEWPLQQFEPGEHTMTATYEVAAYLPKSADTSNTDVYVKAGIK